ncbi:MAG: TIGR03905 family TSCPD domain-containing protein [Roseburia sp.]|nr:TIGR03905 family TSCPD domain-containing protein [Ruminococcus sp.]MCM1155239.1 TIGR03905 family TSCPD domain-containing protein [Roseburia sp.]MCM1241209.1 TIGR03905 family TSCPD domain-containing protein [Roseburia sp.]
MIYKPQGVCSKAIDIEVEEGVIRHVEFTGGCNGNLQGISSLVTDMKIEDAIKKLKGIKCGFKTTSCPDQLAHALEEIAAGAGS